ncbi:(p)ppGpp synthetase [Alkalispirochaeta odontotermitis]|nr:(p)ppGpp synthetase [Alkalispirochaeta odontotermitis]
MRRFAGSLGIYPRTERRSIINALNWSRKLHEGQKRASGEPYIIHPIRTAEALIDFKLDPQAIKGALLHDALEDTEATKNDIIESFGTEVAALIEGVTKIDDINVGTKAREAASLRKMVWAMVDDLRVILIKLADKRHNMHTLQYIVDDKRRDRIARECLEIYAPMAGKLGMSSLKSELEDLSFKYLQPDYYTLIRDHVALKKEERKLYLEYIQEDLLQAATKARVKIVVSTRAKHFYSIFRKMKDRDKDIDEIYDLLGVRIICESTVACYTILGVTHSLWAPLEGRFKDYIASPKSNGYRSLHTSVLTQGGRPLEIQIRSQSMHETAEYGVAAHWTYKEKKRNKNLQASQFALVEQLKDLRNESYDDDTGIFLDTIKRDVLQDSIILYTPKGDPIELPEGSTAIDFAYHIHSEVGSHCMGAKANGAIIPLTRPLANTQTIQILTAVNAHPHVNWLKHVRSTRARNKIRSWLNHHEADVIIDRNIVARKKKIEVPNKEAYNKPETKILDLSKVGISVANGKNVMIRISQCCSPSPGDKIIGYISHGRGIIVHSDKCSNLKGIANFEARQIQVNWETVSLKNTQRFRIHSKYTHELFSEIERAIRKYRGHLISGSLDETERGELEGYFTVEVENFDDFGKISGSVRAIPSVLSILKVQNLQNNYYG